MSGAIAVAETLGRFAEYGVTSAFYWTYPPADSPLLAAYRAYRNFDGKGGRFEDRFVQSASSSDLSMFVSRDAHREHYVIIAINLRQDSVANTTVELSGCAEPTSSSLLSYSGSGQNFAAQPVHQNGVRLTLVLPPYSISVLELRMPNH